MMNRMRWCTLIFLFLACKVHAQDWNTFMSRSFDQWTRTWNPGAPLFIDSLQVSENTSCKIFLNNAFSHIAWREPMVDTVYQHFYNQINTCDSLQLICMGYPLEALVPNWARKTRARDSSRSFDPPLERKLFNKRLSEPWSARHGLGGRHIALWGSHGWYYSQAAQRWEWQRPRLFGTVEDLLPTSFMIPYLLPMLERAGATAWYPRERDVSSWSLIVDEPSRHFKRKGRWNKESGGFSWDGSPIANNANVMRTGRHLISAARTGRSAAATWKLEIPAAGNFAVYVAYVAAPDRCEEAMYTIRHGSNISQIAINQTQAGNTWVYLGHFHFPKGHSSITLTNPCNPLTQKSVSADAVRIGGGMGRVARAGSLSGRAAWMEGARYHLQFSGAPEWVYNIHKDTDDYKDDYMSRGEWVNWLKKDLGIPVDLSLAFHTDAGIRPDTVVGTLMIVSTRQGDYTLDGRSRLASRDWGDLLQTQIVTDLQSTWNPQWTRRAMWDRPYNEAWRPQVPAALLELLSHQNAEDMQYALEPTFRKTVARSIYKAMLRYLHDRQGTSYIVQPLEPLRTRIHRTGTDYQLRWAPQSDPLEATATPSAYLLYHKTPGQGWDQGTLVRDTFFNLLSKQWEGVHGFRVEAVNEGGRSLPGETVYLAIPAKKSSSGMVHLVLAGARESGPAWIEAAGYKGVDIAADPGQSKQPLQYYTGPQYDYLPTSPFITNDAPGHGASMAIWEGKFVPQVDDWGMGNLVENWYRIGYTVLAGTGLPESQELKANDILSLHFGNQHQKQLPGGSWTESIWTPAAQGLIQEAAQRGCKLLLSGAYIGSDLSSSDTIGTQLAAKLLGWKWRSTRADGSGQVQGFQGLPDLQYGIGWGHTPFHAPVVDALESAQSKARVLGRYGAGQKGAVVGIPGLCLTAGFPLETISPPYLVPWLEAVVQWLTTK